MNELGKKVAVVFGSGGNLGPIWCETLRQAGAFVIALDLPQFDVTNHELRSDYPVDIVVYNAAIDNPPGSDASFFGNFQPIMDVNIGGAVRAYQSLISNMRDNGGGVLINVSSIQGRIGADWRNYDPGFEKPVGYNCSKAALEQLTRSVAVQYGRYNIRAVTIAFGCVDTGKVSEEFANRFNRNVPLGRLISRESLEATLLYACLCPELTGQTVLVDGGYTAL